MSAAIAGASWACSNDSLDRRSGYQVIRRCLALCRLPGSVSYHQMHLHHHLLLHRPPHHHLLHVSAKAFAAAQSPSTDPKQRLYGASLPSCNVLYDTFL